MKAEETVMSKEELTKLNNAMPAEAKYGDVFKAIAEAQAEISFKAGQEEERRGLNYCEKHKLYYSDCCPNCFEEKGRKEVVEFLDMPNNFYQILKGEDPEYGRYSQTWSVAPKYIDEVAKERGKDAMYLVEISYAVWQAKLKEWGKK